MKSDNEPLISPIANLLIGYIHTYLKYDDFISSMSDLLSIYGLHCFQVLVPGVPYAFSLQLSRQVR